jgi:hypothetical protein
MHHLSQKRWYLQAPRHEDAYDPQAVALMQSVLDEAWRRLPPGQRPHTTKADLALRILNLAARGERDPRRLLVRAMTASPSVQPREPCG